MNIVELHAPIAAKTNVVRRFLRGVKRWWFRMKYVDSLMDGRMYGKFYVRYKDGQRSINMYYRTAKDYASMFGGEVIECF